MSNPLPAELTVAEAAEKYGISKRSIARAAERGLIPHRRMGVLYVLDAEAVRLYAAVHEARRALDEYVSSETVGSELGEVSSL